MTIPTFIRSFEKKHGRQNEIRRHYNQIQGGVRTNFDSLLEHVQVLNDGLKQYTESSTTIDTKVIGLYAKLIRADLEKADAIMAHIQTKYDSK